MTARTAQPPTVDYAGPVSDANVVPDALPRPSGSPLLWGFYLACSWTWVLGMYLPALLARDYGLGGWLTLTVPNVVGAAAMGWVLRSRESAVRVMRDHTAAVVLFSTVTTSFQIYVLMWLVPRLTGVLGVPLVLPALMLALLAPLADLFGRRGVAVAVWGFSALCVLGLWSAGVLLVPVGVGVRPTWHLLALAPVCTLGFALCPYLDATFLKARAATTDGGAKVAFGVGFGVLFLAMLVGTLLYGTWLIGGGLSGGLANAAAWLLIAHLTVQGCFTVAAHTSASGVSPLNLVGVVAAAVLGMAAIRADLADWQLWGLPLGEHVYRAYLGFYGLGFPAYVLFVILGRRSVRAMLVSVAVVLPLFGLGFLKRDMPIAAVGVVVLFVAFWLSPRRPS